MKPEAIALTGDICGEAATWDAERQTLWWVDINRFLVHALKDGAVRSWDMGGPAVALSLTTDSRLLVALRQEIILWNPDSQERLSLARLDDEGCRFNDGRTDPNGWFWIGTMADNVGPAGENLPVQDGKGRLFRLNKTLEPKLAGLGIANTVCWSPDQNTLYFGDTLANEIRAYNYDGANGLIDDGQPHLAGFERGLPDGSAIDADGYLWNCRYGGGCVVRVKPSGEVDQVIDMPVKNITTACFGGPDLSTLFITTASSDKAASDRLAGSIFAIETPTKGLPENRLDVSRLL